MRVVLQAACVLAVVMSGSAEADDTISGRERFELWHECTPVGLLVEVPAEAQDLTGLSKDEIQMTALRKLQELGLHDPEGKLAILAVHLETAELPLAPSISRVLGRLYDHGAVFLIRVGLLKYMNDPLSNEDQIYRLPTWLRTKFGSFENKPGTWLLSIISGYVDEFIAEYVRVNLDACGISTDKQ